jgi:hypothetical protein
MTKPKSVYLPAAQKIAAWSFSRWKDYSDCPGKYHFKHVQKIPEPAKGEAALRGTAIHEVLERFVLGATRALPRELVATMGVLYPILQKLKKQKAAPEGQVALTRQWGRASDYFGPDVWLRVVFDLVAMAELPDGRPGVRTIDYKTGAERPEEHALQLELGAAAALRLYPEAELVTAEAWYVDHGRASAPMIFTPADAPQLVKRWEARVAPMFKDKTFKFTPGQACRFCPYSGRRGGICKKG